MHITLEADYGIRMMLYLARMKRRVDAKTISENAEVTLRFALKILRKFAASGLVKSFKGIQGGYELAKPAKEITLRAVIETIEGTYYISRCLDPQCGCSRAKEHVCKVKEVFDDISTLVREKLDRVTLDQLL